MLTPKECATRIADTLYGYSGDRITPQDPADIAYALADMMHWADENFSAMDTGRAGDFATPFDDLVAWARKHYDEEKKGSRS